MKISQKTSLSESVLTAMRDVSARVIMPLYNNLSKNDVRAKNHSGGLVTVADEKAEIELNLVLKSLLPGSQCIGEESVSKTPNLIKTLNSDDPIWVIDPIDGTSNYVNGRPKFAVMISLLHGGETVMGWIYNPISDSSLRAEQGEGAWTTQGGDEVRRLKIPPESSGSSSLSNMVAELHHPDFKPYKKKFGSIVRMGSAAHDYWALSDGRLQILSYRRLEPWDHAAGVLIHSEAGGYNRLLSGDNYNPCTPNQSGLLCAPNAHIWAKVLKLTNYNMRGYDVRKP
ncbi:MAG: inositol-1-monophosphatase [Candidatus Marinimicrobia bacterium]|nr:inositol-1-monophosphatase [Candidatus Neomarinimicrobiota bacterium]